MKKTTTKLWQPIKFLLLTLFIFSTFSGCKKDESDVQKDRENQVRSAKSWYAKKTAETKMKLLSSKGQEANLIFNPEWEKAQAEQIGQSSVTAVPIETNLLKFVGNQAQFKLLIVESNNNFEYKIVELTTNKKDRFNDIKDLYTSAFTNNKISITDEDVARIKVYDSQFNVEKITSYDKGGIHKTEQPLIEKINTGIDDRVRSISNKTSVNVVTVCIDWYLTLETYYGNVLITSNTTYIGRECEQIFYDQIAPENPEGGGTSTIKFNFGQSTSQDLGASDAGELVVGIDTFKVANVNWNFHTGGTWWLESTEHGVVKVKNGARTWHDLKHVVTKPRGFWAIGKIELFHSTYKPVVQSTMSRMEIVYDLVYTVGVGVGSQSIYGPPIYSGDFTAICNWDTDFVKYQ